MLWVCNKYAAHISAKPYFMSLHSFANVNLDYQRDNLRTAEDNGNLEISGFLTDWIVMKIADFRFVTNTLLTNRCRYDYVIQRCILWK